MEKRKLSFGKKYRVGNFFVIKYNKLLRKSEAASLRMQIGVPSDMLASLQRSQLPFIKVEAASGIWAVEYCCNTSVFRMIDSLLDESDAESMKMLAHMFNMWFMDTTVSGDKEYVETKAAALKGFMERCKAKGKELKEKASDGEPCNNEEGRAKTVKLNAGIDNDRGE